LWSYFPHGAWRLSACSGFPGGDQIEEAWMRLEGNPRSPTGQRRLPCHCRNSNRRSCASSVQPRDCFLLIRCANSISSSRSTNRRISPASPTRRICTRQIATLVATARPHTLIQPFPPGATDGSIEVSTDSLRNGLRDCCSSAKRASSCSKVVLRALRRIRSNSCSSSKSKRLASAFTGSWLCLLANITTFLVIR
jgi:hypothetical protein